MIIKKPIHIDGKKVLIGLVLFEHLFFYYFNNIMNRDQLIDPLMFYNKSFHLDTSNVLQLISPGTRFMLFITMLFNKVFNSFTIVSLIFSLLCFIPYYDVINKYYKSVFNSENLFWKITFLIILFMPSMHVWMTSIYKEALIFPVMYLLLQKINQTAVNILKWDVIVYFLLLFFIRPYLSGIIILGCLITNYKYLSKKIILITLLCSLVFFIAFWYLILPNVNFFSIQEKLGEINETSKSLGYAVIDLETTNYFQRLIYMLFRPLFFDANTRFQFFYSLENLMLVIWFLLFLYLVIKKSTLKIKYLMQSVFIMTSVFIWLFISVYIYNYGLASRMKVMIVPFFLIGILDILKNKVSEKNY